MRPHFSLAKRAGMAAAALAIGVTGFTGLASPASAATTPTYPAPPVSSQGFKWDFKSASAPTAAGYTADIGEAYSSARKFGWVNETTGAPASVVGNGRERKKLADKKADTFVHMDLRNGEGVKGGHNWVADVPNGLYRLTVGIGDPSYTDSQPYMRFADAGPSLPRNVNDGQFFDLSNGVQEKSAITIVSNGKLKLDQSIGVNTKLAYVSLTPVATNALLATGYPTDVNFGIQPEGYNNCAGGGMGCIRAEYNNGKTKWQTLDGKPLDLSANVRVRNYKDQYGTNTSYSFIHMDFQGTSNGVRTPAKFVYGGDNKPFANVVSVTVGDKDYIDSRNVIRVNGKVIADFTPTDKERTKTFTSPVYGTGSMVIDQVGGKNTKISNLRLVAVR